MIGDKNVLEFWGRVFLNAAQSQQQLEDINKIIGQNTGVDNPFINSLFNSFGWQNTLEKNTEGFIELIRKLSGQYNEFIKTYLAMFNVVSEEKHLKLIKENEELKAKIAELENIISSNKGNLEEINHYPKKIVDELTQIMSEQTRQFQELVKQLNPPSKMRQIRNNKNDGGDID